LGVLLPVSFFVVVVFDLVFSFFIALGGAEVNMNR